MVLLSFLDLVFDSDGKEKDICVDIIPPLPIMRNDYWCGKKFLTDSIIDLYKTHDNYGIVLIGGDEVLMYNFSGSRYNQIDKITICRQKNHKMGGQSAQRFDRIHDNQVNEYVKKISERINLNYIDRSNGSSIVKRLIIAGVGDVKDRVIRDGWLDKIILSILTKVITLSQLSIIKVLDKLPDLIKQSVSEDDSKILDTINNDLHNGNNEIVYGLEEIKESIRNCKLKELVVHVSIENSENSIDPGMLDIARETGCRVYILNSYSEKCISFINNYGGIIGRLWFN